MDTSPLLQRYVDESLALVPRWMGAVAHEARQALFSPSTSLALRDIASQPMGQAEGVLSREHPRWARRVGELLAERWRRELTVEAPDAVAAAKAALPLDALSLVDETQAEENIELLRAVQLVDLAVEAEARELQARSATLRGETSVRKHSNLLRADLVVHAVWDASEVFGLAPPARKALMRAAGDPLAKALKQVTADAVKRLSDWGIEPAAWKASALAAPAPKRAPHSGYDLTRPGALDSLRGRLPAQRAADAPIAGLAAARAAREADALAQMEGTLARVLALPSPAGSGPGVPRLSARLPYLEAVARHQGDREVITLVAALFDALLDDPLVRPPVQGLIAQLQGPVLRIAMREPRLLDDHAHPSWQLMVRLASHTAGFVDDDDPRLCALLGGVRTLFARLEASPHPTAAEHAQALAELDGLLVAELDAERRQVAGAIDRLALAARRSLLRDALRQQIRLQLQDASSPWQLDGAPSAAEVGRPAFVLDETLARFLLGPWVDVLVHAVLHDGEQAPVTQDLLAVLDDLLDSLAPGQGEAGRKRLVAAIPGLVQRLQDGMARIALPPAERQAVLDALMARHTDVLRGADSRAAPLAASESPEAIVRRLREEPVPPPAGEGASRGDTMFDAATLDTVPAALMPDEPAPQAAGVLGRWPSGLWLRLIARGAWTHARVLWTDESRAHWLLSDAEAGLTHSLTRRALEHLGQAGLAQPLEERNLLERAVDALLVGGAPR